MSEPRTRKRRAAEEGSITTLTTTHRQHKPTFISQQQLETLQAELDHERSLRQLDQKRAKQAQQRLEKQLELAVEEAAQASNLLEEVQAESERTTSQLRQARNEALAELRQCQLELEQHSGSDEDESVARFWEEKCHRLESQLEEYRGDDESLRNEIDRLRSEMETRLEEQKRIIQSPTKLPPVVADAPPEVMKELNRVRIQLAESERRERQLNRTVEDLQRRGKRLIQEREEARSASQRLPAIEKELQDLRRDYETVAAENGCWKSFRQSLNNVLKSQDDSSLHTMEGPSEVSTVVRFLDKARSRADEMERQKYACQKEIKDLKAAMASNETKVKEFDTKERQWNYERKQLEDKLEASKRHVESLQSQQAIYQREADSLRSLIKTFDDLPLAPKSKGQDASLKLDTSAKTLEVSLSIAREELKLVKDERDRLTKELESAKQNSQDLQKELDRVKEKFGELREALHAERAKVEASEQRAIEAERLAGKGSFHPDETRVLHIKETPLTEALKEEIKVLQRQLEVAKGDKPSKLAPDPEKLNQRLKENFKEQISLFREGVYLMTGYKVDMLPGTDRPTFRVRSVFAEHEEDHFLLKWPKTEEVTSLDILNTDFAKVLATTPSYEYMTKFHSLPAFLASVQLSLFEKQTVLM